MKKVFMMLMAMVMVVMMAGCGGGDKKAAQAPKVLKVGTEPTFAPFDPKAISTVSKRNRLT